MKETKASHLMFLSHVCYLSYDAGRPDASEYYDDGIGKVQPPKVKIYIANK